MRLSTDLQISLSLAMSEAGRLGHEYAGLEHLLYALTFDDEASGVLRHAGADVQRVQRLLADYLAEAPSPAPPCASKGPAARRSAAPT
jgi:ATP-dependent Clp protease ATP-binding subunit ClpA